MKKNLMWAYFIHLSRHQWGDETSPAPGRYLDPDDAVYNNVDLDTWDEVIQNLPRFGYNTVVIDVGDAVQYESHPEISAPDAWSKEFMKKKLDEICALGMTPIPKLNFSAAHDTWLKQYGRMISTPIYYQVCADLILEVCDLFDRPAFFHLGMDEETDRYQQHHAITVIRHQELWWHDINFLFEQCGKNGARPFIWTSHTLNTYRDSFLEKMPKSVLQTITFNSKVLFPANNGAPLERREERAVKAIKNLEFLIENGYEIVLVGNTWSYYRTIQQVAGLAKELVPPKAFKGIMIASWLPTFKEERYALLSNAEKLYYARRKFLPETL